MSEHRTPRRRADHASPTTSARSAASFRRRSRRGQITAIVGANACGKSTLLRGAGPAAEAQARRRSCSTARTSTRCRPEVVATKLGILPQPPSAPSGITVTDLVARGRYPHQKLVRQWTADDEARRRRARWSPPSTLELADRVRSTRSPAASASGSGSRWRSRRRPTSCCSTSRPPSSTCRTRSTSSTCSSTSTTAHGRTIVLVVHDLNHAARYAHHLIAMRDGRDLRRGPARRDRHRGPRRADPRHALADHHRPRQRDADGHPDRPPRARPARQSRRRVARAAGAAALTPRQTAQRGAQDVRSADQAAHSAA